MIENTLTKENINYILNNYSEIPISEISKHIGCTIVEVTKELRRKGKINEITIDELNYILENKDRKIMKDIKEDLGLTDTQFYQVCKRYSIGKQLKGREEYSEDEVIAKTKYLLEDKLKLNIDDILASKITSTTIIKAGGYPLIHYAEKRKGEDNVYKYFSAVAYLFHLAYPGRFRPYQFMHSPKTIEYFNQKIYLGELITIMEEKLSYNLEFIDTLVKSNDFLSRKCLQFYGLGPHLYNRLFESKKDMIKSLLVHLNISNLKTFEKTDKLKMKLENEGIDTTKCYCKWCKNTQIQIHHMKMKKDKEILSFDVDETFNLIPLCTEHHAIIGKFNYNLLKMNKKDEWRQREVEFIEDYEKNISLKA